VQKYLDSNDEVMVVGEELPNSQKSPSKDRTTDIKFITPAGIIRHSMKPVRHSLLIMMIMMCSFVERILNSLLIIADGSVEFESYR